MSKELIERLREAAAQRVASTAMIGADDLIAAADALESLEADRDRWERQAGDRLDDVLRVVAERDALANRVYQLEQKNSGAAEIIAAMQETHAEDQAELKALREQEPSCWTTYPPSGRYSKCKAEVDLWGRNNWTIVPLYAHPAPTRELTDEEILNALDAKVGTQFLTMPVTRKELWLTNGSVDVREFVRAIEAAIKGEGK